LSSCPLSPLQKSDSAPTSLTPPEFIVKMILSLYLMQIVAITMPKKLCPDVYFRYQIINDLNGKERQINTTVPPNI
jgi:hypothetical protein